ncbi:MFS transporter [Arcticibacter sp. MXS-1]|uniref:MFS transporter n=1 Tax=Arcticibacter sp. MXS-1 TaxID=3341726 RepID=UPI0035A952E5
MRRCGARLFLYFRRRSGDDVPVKDEKEESNIQAAAPSRSPWKDFYFLIFSVLCCLYNICFFQLLNTLPLFYREVHHLNESDIGLILAYSGLVVFSLEMLIVHIADRRMSAVSAIVLGTVACGASYSMLLLPGKFLLLYTAMFLLCISEILAMPFMGTVTMRRASQGTQGAYMGMNALSFSLAHVLSPLIGTRVADGLGFTSLWAATGTVAILTALGFWFVGRRI